MFDGFGAVLDRLQGLLGKSYLLTGFFPMLLAVLLSLPLVPLVAPEFPYWVQDALDLPAGKQVLVGFCLLMLVAFLGFVVHVMNSWFRRRIESGILPAFRPWLVRVQQARLQEMQGRLKELRPDMVNYRIEVRDGNWENELRAARVRGLTAGGPGPVRQATLDRMDAMERCRTANEGIPFEDAERAFHLVREDLEHHDADALPDLNRAQIRFRELAGYG